MRFSTRCLAVCLFVSVLMPGCFSVHTVKPFPGDASQPEGIPFFLKKGIHRLTTVYTVTWYELAIPSANGSPEIYLLKDVPGLKAAVLRAEKRAGDAKTGWPAALRAEGLDSIGGAALEAELALQRRKPGDGGKTRVERIANQVRAMTVPDYESRYAVTTNVPLFASGSSTVKLAADGTLSEATAELDTSSLADVLPIKEAVSKAAGIESSALVAPNADGGPTLTRRGYVYTLTADLSRAPSPGAVIPFDLNSHWFTRKSIGSPDKAEEKPTATFSGAIKVPR